MQKLAKSVGPASKINTFYKEQTGIDLLNHQVSLYFCFLTFLSMKYWLTESIRLNKPWMILIIHQAVDLVLDRVLYQLKLKTKGSYPRKIEKTRNLWKRPAGLENWITLFFLTPRFYLYLVINSNGAIFVTVCGAF